MAEKAEKKSGGAINSKVVLAAAGIAVISSLSSFVAIRFAMPKQVIIEKQTVTVNGEHGAGHKEAEPAPGPVWTVGEFIVNLADPGRRYLKTTVVLQFNAEGDGAKGGGGHGGGGSGGGDAMAAKMAPFEPILKDIIVSTLSRQTVDKLAAPLGKEALKDELKARINKEIPSIKVYKVYFTDFVIQ